MYGVISKLLQEYKHCQMISNKKSFVALLHEISCCSEIPNSNKKLTPAFTQKLLTTV